MLGRILLSLTATLIALGAVLYPTLKLFGVFRSPVSLNNEDCVTIPGTLPVTPLYSESTGWLTFISPLLGLEACEEGWVDRRLGIAYL